MTTMSDLDDLWVDPIIAAQSRRFYSKCIKCLVRILIIYFVCQYLFIPKI